MEIERAEAIAAKREERDAPVERQAEMCSRRTPIACRATGNERHAPDVRKHAEAAGKRQFERERRLGIGLAHSRHERRALAHEQIVVLVNPGPGEIANRDSGNAKLRRHLEREWWNVSNDE